MRDLMSRLHWPSLSLKHIVTALAAIILIVIVALNLNVELQDSTGLIKGAPAASSPKVPAPESYPVDSSFKQIAETDQLRLKADEKTGHFLVEDKRSGSVYRSFASPEEFNEQFPKGQQGVWRSNFLSPIMLEYTNIKDTKMNPKMTSLYTEGGSISEFKTIENGYSVVFDIPSIGLSIPVQVRIENDFVETKIVDEGIVENHFSLTWIRLFPFMEAQLSNGQDGYMLVPDGSGALIRFSDNKTSSNRSYQERVYGGDESFNGMTYSSRASVMMPVYGMKSDDKAFLAVVQDGDEYSEVIASPAGATTNFNWMTTQYTYRSPFFQVISESRKLNYITYNKDKFMSNRVTRYYILDRQQADYVGMGARYRQYLMDEQGATRLKPQDANIPLFVTIIGADLAKGNISDRYLRATSLGEAKEIIQSLHDQGVASMQVNIMGWQDGGYSKFGSTFPVDSRLGGNNGMKTFTEFAHNLNIPVYLQHDYTTSLSGEKGFDQDRQGIVNLAGDVLQDSLMNNDTIAFVSDQVIQKRVNKEIDVYKGLGVDGIVSESLGRYVYSNYNARTGATRSEAKDIQQRIFEDINGKLGSVQAIRPSFYTIGSINHIYRLPNDYSYDLFSDQPVPFAQIATHGLITYTSEYSNNRQQPVEDFLRDMEYGYYPSYIFTKEETALLSDAYGLAYYSTHFEDWHEDAVKEYSKFNEAFADVQGEFIIDHRTLSDRVNETTYEGGKRIIVNYNSTDYRSGSVEVPAQSYLIIEGGSGQ